MCCRCFRNVIVEEATVVVTDADAEKSVVGFPEYRQNKDNSALMLLSEVIEIRTQNNVIHKPSSPNAISYSKENVEYFT